MSNDPDLPMAWLHRVPWWSRCWTALRAAVSAPDATPWCSACHQPLWDAAVHDGRWVSPCDNSDEACHATWRQVRITMMWRHTAARWASIYQQNPTTMSKIIENAMGEAARLAKTTNPMEQQQHIQTIDTLLGTLAWCPTKKAHVMVWPKIIRTKAGVGPGFREVLECPKA